MSGASIVVDVDVVAAAGKLDKLNAALVNPKPLMSELGEYLLGSTKDRFKTMQAPDGTPWAPLKPSYLKAKKQNKGKILTLGGYLRGQMRWQPDGQDAVLIGSNRVYARIHQLGGTTSPHVIKPRTKKALAFNGLVLKSVRHPGSKIPARPFLGLSREDRQEVTKRTIDWVGRQLK